MLATLVYYIESLPEAAQLDASRPFMAVGILMNYRYVLKLFLPDLKRNYDKNTNTGKQ